MTIYVYAVYLGGVEEVGLGGLLDVAVVVVIGRGGDGVDTAGCGVGEFIS